MTRTMHLSVNLSEYGRHSGGWRHEISDISQIPNTEVYLHASRVAEAGLFDLVFIADTPVHVPGRTVSATRLDPFEMATAIAAETSSIGIIVTISTSYNEPYDVARRAASTDHILNGRLGVNYVASSGDATAQNFNHPVQLPHAERYERSNEFLDVVTGLWAGAPTPDTPGTPTRHDGTHFQLSGQLDVYRPPAGRPVIVQAGSSDEGRDLAALWADPRSSAPRSTTRTSAGGQRPTGATRTASRSCWASCPSSAPPMRRPASCTAPSTTTTPKAPMSSRT
jgi:alkanesulfonate monooxygenase SsuD/methylene tetrahydromethanopterin reductase-like flavin-dependent oxidoreductase (luciferase family)